MNRPHNKPAKQIPKDQLIIGIHAIREALLYKSEKVIHIYAEKGKGSRKNELLELAEEKGIPISYVTETFLTELTGTESHQSFGAHIRGREYLGVKKFLETAKESSLVLMLDQIFDPQNFGALLRSAECFGADAVVWSKNRGCELTPIAAKTSSGASEILPLIRVSNLAEAAVQFQEGGFEVVASTLSEGASPLFGFKFSPRTLLIVGSEGEGIQPLIQKRADRSVFIPMFGKIESLNVAQATSVLLAMFRATDS